VARRRDTFSLTRDLDSKGKLMSRSRIAVLGLATTIAACAALAPSASADTTVMGSTLVNNYDGGVSGGASTVSVQLSFASATSTNPVVSPANGVITGWKVKSADDGAIYSLKVLRPNGVVSLVTATNSNFTAVGSVQAPAAVPVGTNAATPTGQIFSYPAASLPISKGDYVGILTGGADDDLPQSTTGGVPQNLIANNFTAQPTDGAAANLLADEQHDLLLQATVKYCKVPNLVGQTESAATPLLVAGDCTGTVVKKPTKNASEVGKVISTNPAADATAPPGTAVTLEVGVASCKKAKKKGKKGTAAAKKKKKKGCGKKKKKKKRERDD